MTEEEFKKLKPGDKVRIVKKRVAGMNMDGEMDKWLGTVMTVRKVLIGDVQMEEDKGERKDRGWFWDRQMIEYKHRAEVAERALMYAVSEYRCDECPCIDCSAEIRGSQECIDCICEEYINRAEKELAEEKI